MITTAELTFLNQETKEFENKKDGSKIMRFYGYFVQENSEVHKITLLPDQKFEKFKSYKLKIKVKFGSFKTDSGYKNYLSLTQL